jgi:hypothetical protein
MITKYAVIDAGLLYEAARKLAGDDVRDLQIKSRLVCKFLSYQ